MKEWNVECLIDDKSQYEGRAPRCDIYYDATTDFVEAETEEEAIESAIDWVVEQSQRNGYELERLGDSIIVYGDDGDIMQYCYSFRAREVI